MHTLLFVVLNFILTYPLSQFNISLLAIEGVVYCLNPVSFDKGVEATLDSLTENFSKTYYYWLMRCVY